MDERVLKVLLVESIKIRDLLTYIYNTSTSVCLEHVH